jgi:lysine-specific histone demethylase 1B
MLTEKKKSGTVAILGAGASGLAAARVLSDAGISVTIYEATDTPGGRIGLLKGFADYGLDTGAQWLHGTKGKIAQRLKRAGIRFSADASEEFVWLDGVLTKSPKQWKVIQELFASTPSRKELSYAAWAQKEGVWIPSLEEAMAAHFGASADQLSPWGHAKEEENWKSGSNDCLFEKTWYDALLSLYSKEAAEMVQYNTPIVHVDAVHPSREIMLTDAKGKVYKADYVIVTVPLTILRSEKLTFEPAIPYDQQNAWHTIGMGDGMKVFLKFDQAFYHPNTIGGNICGNYFDCSWGRNTNDAVLLAFLTGRQATHLHLLGEDSKRIEVLVQELDRMYNGKASKYFAKGHVCNWSDHPYILGAYSYAATADSYKQRSVAGKPFQKKVFFAGEAMCTNGHRQTVHGAIERGEEVAEEILSKIH